MSTRTIVGTLACTDGQGIHALVSIHCTTNRHLVAAFHFDGSICVWDVRVRTRLYGLKPHNEIAPVCTVAGPLVVTSSEDGTTAGWRWDVGKLIWQKRLQETKEGLGGSKAMVTVQVEWDGKLIAASRDGMLHVIDMNSG